MFWTPIKSVELIYYMNYLLSMPVPRVYDCTKWGRKIKRTRRAALEADYTSADRLVWVLSATGSVTGVSLLQLPSDYRIRHWTAI